MCARAEANLWGRGEPVGPRRGLAGLRDDAPSHISDQAPPVWRAARGRQGQASENSHVIRPDQPLNNTQKR